MLKHPLSPVVEPHCKRIRLEQSSEARDTETPALSDELIVYILSYLSAQELCVAQGTSRDWARLTLDNHLWKCLYIQEYGLRRLRGASGFIVRTDGRQTRGLPGRAKIEDYHKQWKWMFQTSTNWRKGRCSVDIIPETHGGNAAVHTLLAGPLIVTASSQTSTDPRIQLHSPGEPTHGISSCSRQGAGRLGHSITALVLDHSAPLPAHHYNQSRIASFLTTGEFAIFSINHADLASSCRLLTYVPATSSTRTMPIVRAAYHHPVLVTLSQSFSLSIYDVSSDTVSHTQTLTSFTSFPPSSIVLSGPNAHTSAYKCVLAYSTPVYPHHYSIGATELLFSVPSAVEPLRVISTRTTKTVDTPQGWIDEKKLRMMRDQWNRKVQGVAACETDGKWVVMASTPSLTHLEAAETVECRQAVSLQLYRLTLPSLMNSAQPSPLRSAPSQPKLTFIRTLEGPPTNIAIASLYLADGRCVGLSRDGTIWVWDLEAGTDAQVAGPQMAIASSSIGQVTFDDRRLISSSGGITTVRRFDV